MGKAACLGEESSPTNSSRLISRPTSRKKMAIRPSSIQSSRGSLSSKLPAAKVTGVWSNSK